MKLHNILYGAAICFVIIGIAGIDGWMINGTSILIPLALIVVGVILWFFARREDGGTRKKKNIKYYFDRRTL